MSDKLIRRLIISRDNEIATIRYVWKHILDGSIPNNDDIEVQKSIWNRLRELERKRDKLAHYIEQLRPDWSKTKGGCSAPPWGK